MHTLDTDAQHLRIALEASGIGTWQFDIPSGRMYNDSISHRLFDFNDDEQELNYTSLFGKIDIKFRQQAATAIEAAIFSGKDIDIKFRTAPSGSAKAAYLHVRGKAYTNDTKSFYAGTVQDVTSQGETSDAQLESEYRHRSIIEEAPVATALYVSRDLIIGIANDVMLSYWGKSNSVIGMRLEEAVPELEGQPFAQILKSIFDTGEIYQVTESPVLLALNGKLGTYYFDFTYKPLYNPDGEIYAIMNMAVEVTDRVLSKRNLSLSEDRYRSIINHAPVGTCLLVGQELKVEVINNTMLEYWKKDYSVIGKPFEQAMPELVGQPFIDLLRHVLISGETYSEMEAPAELSKNVFTGTYYFDYTFKPLFDADGNVYAIMNMAVDVTERVLSRRKVQQSEARFRAIVDQSPMAIGVLKGRDMIIEVGNDRIFDVWGKTRAITGLSILEALPEIEGQGFMELLLNVYETGEAYYGNAQLAKLEHDGELRDVYFDFIYSALKDENGVITGVLVIANDVTDRVLSIRKIAASEAKFRALMDAAPAAMVLFMGKEDLIIDTPNQALLATIGKDESINGKPLLAALPEMEGTESVRLIRETFETGKKSETFGRQVGIMKDGVIEKNFYNVTYTPIFNDEGNVYAVLDTAIDVTESIKARKAIEEAEASLRGAIELAELGTWSFDPKTGIVTYSERLLKWFGFEQGAENVQNVFNAVHEKDRERVSKAIAKAIEPGSNEIYDEEYTVVNQLTGRERILHAQGKAFFAENGEAYLLTGTAQDITTHRQIQMALENEVRERTLELQAANRGLEDANRMLVASNEELAQYAYVASHDLQEPLRKITMYSNLLNDKDTDQKFASVIDKIIRSSRRMSLLIKDLLEFSRLLNTDARFVQTDLNTIVSALRDDFELLIHEKDAELNIHKLPVINAVPLQMNQLFYNLISNGLKFVPKDRSPKINITCKEVDNDFVSNYIHHPLQHTQYYLLSVKDNGIGIEEQYAKQIFEVFKRLHGREEYSGSGIGLAICRRIAVNHNGVIYTESEVGRGTTFHILLPEKP